MAKLIVVIFLFVALFAAIVAVLRPSRLNNTLCLTMAIVIILAIFI